MCCSSCVPCCICSCTAGMEANIQTTKRARLGGCMEVRDAYRHPGLWPLVPCHTQLGSVHHLRLQFHTPAQCTRLALVWRVRGLSGGAVYGNVWLSADHLPTSGLVGPALSRAGPPVS